MWIERLVSETRGRLLQLLRRSPHTVPELAKAVGVSDNAVRIHLAALERDGMVESAGVRRGTGGKPAQLYEITRGTEELYPKAYARVLTGLLEEIERREGRARLLELVRGAGARAAGGGAEGDLGARVEAAVSVLKSLGADLEVERENGDWWLRGYGCPLSAVVEERHELCALVEELVARMVDRPVTECCDRSGRPRCGFRIPAL